MPYASTKEIPAAAKKLPAHKRKIFRAAFNNAFKEYKGDESKAFATAYAAAKDSIISDIGWTEEARAAAAEARAQNSRSAAQLPLHQQFFGNVKIGRTNQLVGPHTSRQVAAEAGFAANPKAKTVQTGTGYHGTFNMQSHGAHEFSHITSKDASYEQVSTNAGAKRGKKRKPKVVPSSFTRIPKQMPAVDDASFSKNQPRHRPSGRWALGATMGPHEISRKQVDEAGKKKKTKWRDFRKQSGGING